MAQSAQVRIPLAVPDPDQPAFRGYELPGGSVWLCWLGEALGFHLRLAQEASFAAFARRVGNSGLKPGYLTALVVIEGNPGVSQTALGAAMRRDKSTLTPTLRELERRGLVRRERGTTDRRSYALTLTEAGRATLDALNRHASAHDAALDALVGEGNRTALLMALRRLIAGLERKER